MSTHPEIPATDFPSLRERFHTDANDYQILRGEAQGVRGRGDVWDTDYTLERYTAATDRMIGLLDGSIHERSISDPDDPERSQQAPDTVIWLDKSARPVSWLVDGLWEQFAEEGAQKPTDEFLNIDRVNWFVKQGHAEAEAARRLGPDHFDIDKVDPKDIARIRAYFTIGNITEEGWESEVWNLPTRLDGKNVLIVDEVKNRGGTLAVATQLLKRAVPELTVSGDYYWPSRFFSINGKDGASENQQMESAPVWYDAKDSMGRGVGEISHAYWEHLYETEPSQDHLRKKIAWIALSAPHFNRETFEPVPDPKANQLQQDIAYLSYAVGEGKVLRTFDPGRDDETYMDFIQKQGLTPHAYRDYREKRSRKPNSNK